MRTTIVLAVGNAADRADFGRALNAGQQHEIELVSGPEEVRERLERAQPVHGLVLSGVPHDAISAELFRRFRARDAGLPVIVVFDSATPRETIDALDAGATNVLLKPVRGEALCSAVRAALASRRTYPSGDPRSCPGLLAVSSSMQRLASEVHRACSSDAPVLIQGETGVGKEVLARQLHLISPRARMPFLKVNCAALPSELVESELFGYDRGAFTGAAQNKPGLFDLADTGVIMLDEIGDMDLRLQAKLLQVLQDQQFRRLGGKQPIQVNVRIIAATHADLETSVANAAFRADLYYRLNVITLHVPPLRERREDILPLAHSLIERHSSCRTPAQPIPPMLERALLTYHWPGNVRELENVVRKLLILRNPDRIAAELNGRAKPRAPSEIDRNLPEPLRPPLEEISKAGAEAEAATIRAVLDATRWNRKAAAYRLRIGYKALLYRMKKLEIVDVDVPLCPPQARRDASSFRRMAMGSRWTQ